MKAGKAVGIVGGGVGGLALAVGLQARLRRYGLPGHVRVYDANPPPSGPGSLLLGLNKGALSSLHGLSPEIGTAVLRESESLCGIKLVDPQGMILEEISADAKSGEVIHAIPRDSLRSIFMRGLDDQIVSFDWNNAVKSVQMVEDTQVKIGLEKDTRTPLRHDVVVGCDGLNSVVRRHLFSRLYDTGVHNPRFLGLYGISGVTEGGNSLVAPELHNSVSNVFSEQEEMVLSLQCYRDLIYWNLVYKSPEVGHFSNRPASLRTEALQKIKEWHTPFGHVIEAATLGSIQGMPLCDREPLNRLELSKRSLKRTIVIGDALHPLCPLVGGFGENTNISLAEVNELCDVLDPFLAGRKEGPELEEDLLSLQATMTEASIPFIESARCMAIRIASASKSSWSAQISREMESLIEDKASGSV